MKKTKVAKNALKEKMPKSVKKIEVTCVVCHKKIMVYEARVERYKACSKTCLREYQIRNRKEVACIICGKKSIVNASRARHYKTCSKECLGKHTANVLSRRVPKKCIVCGKEFQVKTSSKNRRHHCSKRCQAVTYSQKYLGLNNPNFRDRKLYNGYAIGLDKGGKSGKIHRAVVYEHFNIENVPNSYSIHHRNANKLDNRIENLALLDVKDHKWLHHQFGNAILNAIFANKISIDQVCSYSKDPIKAKQLLSICILDEAIVNDKVIYQK